MKTGWFAESGRPRDCPFASGGRRTRLTQPGPRPSIGPPAVLPILDGGDFAPAGDIGRIRRRRDQTSTITSGSVALVVNRPYR